MRSVRFAWRNGPISFRGLLASSVSQRNGRSVRLSSPLRSWICVEKKLRESALKSRESFALVNLRVGACPARPSSSCGLVCSTVRDDADVEGAEIREKRLAFAVAREMNEVFDSPARALAPIRALGRSGRTSLARGGAGDLRQSGFRRFR